METPPLTLDDKINIDSNKPRPNNELFLTPEMEVKGDFENIKTPEDFLEAIDFDTLNTIFDELIEKSGGMESVQNTGYRVSKEKIFFYPELNKIELGDYSIAGEANVSGGSIKLTWEIPTGEKITPAIVLNKLRTLAHEATHIRGSRSEERGEFVTKDEYKSWTRKGNINTGLKTLLFEIRSNRPTDELKIGENLNEAVTENIGQSVLREYLIRTGNGVYLNDKLVLDEIGTGSYALERISLECVQLAMSQILDLPIDVIKKSFVHEYMSGNTQLMRLFEEIGEIMTHLPNIKKIYLDLIKNIDLNENESFSSILDSLKLDIVHVSELNTLAIRLALMESLDFRNAVLNDLLGLRG